MQSFRQYRQLGDVVDQQLKSHRENETREKGAASPEGDDPQYRAKQHVQDHVGVQPPSASQKSISEGRRSSHTASTSRAQGNAGEEGEEAEQGEASTESLRAIPTESERSIASGFARTLTGLTVRSRLTQDGGELGQSMFVVGYQGQEDVMNPLNWSHWKRWYATLIVALIGAVVGAASAIDASVVSNVAREYGVSRVVESLASGLFLVGFAVGSLFAGPVSETVGWVIS